MAASQLTLEGLVHDLNNVFQTISDSAEVLQSDPRWVKLARKLRRSASHGQRLAQSVLATKQAPVETTTVIERAIQFSRDYLENAEVPAMEFSLEVEAQIRLDGDAMSWERVLVNLFLNAAEAGARHVSVLATKREIIVRDDGPGIPEDLLPRIFQPHVSTKSILAGLGLTIVQSMVEQNGASVTAANHADGGAEFRIALPAPL
jgi:signal transduction histidine kinase